MPVYLEKVTKASEQDIIDLEKIYCDFPGDVKASELQKQSDSQHLLFAARFNDRLLGAMQVVFQDEVAQINYLCVREVTRKRHVARDMLRLLISQYPKQNFTIKAEKDNPALQGLMRLMQFQETPEGYLYLHG